MIPFELNYYLKSLWAQAPGLVILQVSLTKLHLVRNCPSIPSELQANDKHLPCSSALGLFSLWLDLESMQGAIWMHFCEL
jgi:hypothetical protein